MKNKRVLVSLAMLLVSAIMLSTASFAWFSMNTDVKVEGIEFVAYSDSLFLEISKDNQTFTPNDIPAELTKQYLRPIAYGTIEDMGGAYTIEPEEVIDAEARFDPDKDILYYRAVKKATTNDTYYADEDAIDYYCVNEELRGPSSTEGLYIEGDGIEFTVITDEEHSGDKIYEKVGNNYIVKNLGVDESAYGYYTIETTSPCDSDATYESDKKYYEYYEVEEGKPGNYYLAGGLDEGSYLKGYYTFDPVEADVAYDTVYWLESVVDENDEYPDYIAFVSASEDTGDKDLPADGYWYRGYSESLNTTFDVDAQGNVVEADGQPGKINGVINGTHPNTDSPYYLYTTYYLRMAEASNLASNLRINSVEVIGSELENSLSDAVRVMLVVTSSVQKEVVRIIYNNGTGEFMRETKADGRDHDDTTLFYERFLGDQKEVVTVEVYMYYDGTDAKVNTNYALDFSGHTVNLEFGIDTPDYLK